MAAAYQVLVVDLDGTLTASDGTVSAVNRQALRRARTAGLEVIIATGRALSESRRILDAIEHEGLVIAAGGSLLSEASSGRTLDRRLVPRDVVVRAVRALTDHGHRTLVLKDGHATGYDYLIVGTAPLDPASTWWFGTLGVELRYADAIEDDPHPGHTLRTGAVASADVMLPIADRLREEIGDQAMLQHWSAVTATHATGSPTHLLEIFHRAVNKWTMLEAWCAREGVEHAAVAAIGDGLNDVELLAGAGLGVAMANADPRVLAVADRVTGHHDEDGFAHAVDKLLAGEW